MPHQTATGRFSKRSWDQLSVEVRQAENEHLMEGIVAGCALVAYSDGGVTDDEHDRMLQLIRVFEPVRTFGLVDVIATFETRTRQFAADQNSGEVAALEAVARVRGSRYSELLVETCCAIAASDGRFEASEHAAASRICQALNLNPSQFGIAHAG